MANERLIFLACNIYSILTNTAFIAVHLGERYGPWASGFTSYYIPQVNIHTFATKQVRSLNVVDTIEIKQLPKHV